MKFPIFTLSCFFSFSMATNRFSLYSTLYASASSIFKSHFFWIISLIKNLQELPDLRYVMLDKLVGWPAPAGLTSHSSPTTLVSLCPSMDCSFRSLSLALPLLSPCLFLTFRSAQASTPFSEPRQGQAQRQ